MINVVSSHGLYRTLSKVSNARSIKLFNLLAFIITILRARFVGQIRNKRQYTVLVWKFILSLAVGSFSVKELIFCIFCLS